MSIVTNPDKLKQVSRDTSVCEVERLGLRDKIKKANSKAWTKGCGLAAIQIGVPLRYAWFKWGEDEFELINPKILSGKKIYKDTEGCLSIPNRWLKVPRFYKIKYISNGLQCTAKGFKAKIIQHEIDHMDGILITDL